MYPDLAQQDLEHSKYNVRIPRPDTTRVVSYCPIKTGPDLGPDTPLPRTRRGAVVLFVCPHMDRFTSYPPRSKRRRKITLMMYKQNA